MFAAKSVTRDNVLALTRELATLLRAGLPLDRALEMLISLADAPPVATLLQGIRDDVRGGKALSQALDARREVFGRFYVNIVRAGEAGGALGTVLSRLADTMERNKELRESVVSALIYPTILIAVAVLSLMLILIYVVPQFEQTFAQAGKALPLPTQVVIFLGTFVKQWWWAIAAVRGALRDLDAPPAARSCRPRPLGCALAARAASRRRDHEGRDGALRADAFDAARQRGDAARRGWPSSGKRSATACSRTRSTAWSRDCAKARVSAGRSATRASIRNSPCR